MTKNELENPQNNFQRNTSNNQLIFQQNNLEDLFQQFIIFIDATPNTVRTYRGSLKQWFLYLRQNQIGHPDSETVRQYRQKLQNSGKKPTTVKNYIIAVKRFFEWTEEAGFYPNIAKYIKSGHLSKNFKKDYLTSSQAKKILDEIDRSTLKGKRDYAMLVTMLTMGLRTIEITRANIEDIRTKGDATVLYVQGKGHEEKDDLIRMPYHVETAIRDYLSVRNIAKPSAPLFVSTSNHNHNGRMTTRSIRRIVKTAFISAGFNSPRLTAHSTRHTAATLSLLNGATLQQTQELLRHKNIGTTEIYAHNIDATTNPAATDVEKAIFGTTI
ncbi:tyrosine-type recombinase/integrase [Lactobacillus johnsonii]|uniref:tyrosine-type recombinase/integrase n=1 Tax=Lactobacillus johnsonii TaxID=33959 RepID=UPI0019D4ADD0|nr:tyrosine-type recombinase/integrase [Lactobacillus johnsonii]